MTLRKWVEDYCLQRGMLERQAKAVADAVEVDKANEGMNGRWSDDTSGYPGQLLAGLKLSIKRNAVAYIEENCPLASFKWAFDRTADKLG